MKKIKPYLILAVSVLAILTAYKILIQPSIPASLASKLPSV